MNERERELARTVICELRKQIAGMFPKKCRCCGKVYRNLDEFLANTDPVPTGNSMLDMMERDDFSIIDFNRNCKCGSTLMVVTNERRDRSPQGIRLREKFEEALHRLKKLGYTREAGRNELLKIMHGEETELALSLFLKYVMPLQP